MDSTDKYIRMCEQASELQAMRKEEVSHQSGDNNNKGQYTWFSNDGGVKSIRIYIFYGTANWETGSGVWLPTQDQLQDMLLEDYLSVFDLMRNFNKFGDFEGKKHNASNKYTCFFNSLEQLWLGFYMKEVHNKLWSGDKWIIK